MNLKEVVYHHNYRFRPSLAETFWFYKQTFLQFRKFVWVSFVTNFKASYRQSFFGIIWKIILPLVPVIVYVALQELGVLKKNDKMPAAVYVVVGMTFWQLFSSSVLTIISVAQKERALLKKNKLPFILFYFSSIGEVIFDYLVRVALILVLFINYDVSVNASWLLLPILFIPVLLLGLALGIYLSFFSIFYSDFRNIVDIVFRYGLFVSGVLFPLSSFGLMSKILALNPVYIILDSLRNLLVLGTIDQPVHFLVTISLVSLLLVLSLKKLYSMEPIMREHL